MPGTLQHYPLGHTITGSPHSVCVSLPKLRDVVGYEKKDPRVLGALQSGYPRFFEHPLIRQLKQAVFPDFAPEAWESRITDDEEAACVAIEYAGGEGRVLESDGLFAVGIRKDLGDERAGRLRSFFQHTGIAISSRQAEDLLVARGLIPSVYEEEVSDEPDADRLVRHHLHACYNTRSPEDIFIFRGGMNAFYAGFRAVHEIQRKRGREKWIQLGWLYVDTIRILDTMAGRGNRIVRHDVGSILGVERILAEQGGSIAGVVTEVPTNPLVETADVATLRKLADKYGFALVLDPTIATPQNVNVLPYADVHINSLTKYAASRADVMIGALALNARSRFYDELRARVGKFGLVPYHRDLRRLAYQIRNYGDLVQRVNKSVPAVVELLESHPAVTRVHWAYQKDHDARFRYIAHREGGPGSIITFSLGRGKMETFYDAVRMAKGPSFGAEFSMLCPFLYLAHFDLVSTEEGRAFLEERGLDPELIRLSVGAEDAGDICAVLKEALDATL